MIWKPETAEWKLKRAGMLQKRAERVIAEGPRNLAKRSKEEEIKKKPVIASKKASISGLYFCTKCNEVHNSNNTEHISFKRNRGRPRKT